MKLHCTLQLSTFFLLLIIFPLFFEEMKIIQKSIKRWRIINSEQTNTHSIFKLKTSENIIRIESKIISKVSLKKKEKVIFTVHSF